MLKRNVWSLQRENSKSKFKQSAFIVNENFPDISQSANIKISKKRGRYVEATADIKTGEIVCLAKPFVAVVDRTNKPYCLTCLKVDEFYFLCDKCGNVRFCSAKCKVNNRTHQYECGTSFHRIDFKKHETVLKCAMQMVFQSIAIFQNRIDDLVKYVNNENNHKVNPEAVNDDRSRFRCILNLKSYGYPSVVKEAQTAYNYMKTYPKIASLFRTDVHWALLQHLLVHNLAVSRTNTFGFEFVKGVKAYALFDTISYFNHSCSANVKHSRNGIAITGVANRPIKAGEELCITYVDLGLSTIERRQILYSSFHFVCMCEKCKETLSDRNDFLRRSRSTFIVK